MRVESLSGWPAVKKNERNPRKWNDRKTEVSNLSERKYVYVSKTDYGDAPWENNILEIAEKLRPPPCPEVPGKGGARGDRSRRGNRGNRGQGTGNAGVRAGRSLDRRTRGKKPGQRGHGKPRACGSRDWGPQMQEAAKSSRASEGRGDRERSPEEGGEPNEDRRACAREGRAGRTTGGRKMQPENKSTVGPPMPGTAKSRRATEGPENR